MAFLLKCMQLSPLIKRQSVSWTFENTLSDPKMKPPLVMMAVRTPDLVKSITVMDNIDSSLAWSCLLLLFVSVPVLFHTMLKPLNISRRHGQDYGLRLVVASGAKTRIVNH